MRIDWASSKISVQELEAFLSTYLADNYDGVSTAGPYLYVMTLTPLTGEQEDYILDWYYTTNSLPKEVTTQFEKDDKRLKLARAEGEYDVNGECVITFKVPTGGRSIAGGYAFCDVFYPGDACTSVILRDVDDVLGYGAGAPIAAYSDDDVAEENQGWYFEPSENNTGSIEIEPIGGYGSLPEALYLEIYFKRQTASLASKVFVNVWWGKVE